MAQSNLRKHLSMSEIENIFTEISNKFGIENTNGVTYNSHNTHKNNDIWYQMYKKIQKSEKEYSFLIQNLVKLQNYNNGNFCKRSALSYIKSCEDFLGDDDAKFSTSHFNSDTDFEHLIENLENKSSKLIVTKYYKESEIYLQYVRKLILRAHCLHNKNLINQKIDHGMKCSKCLSKSPKSGELCIIDKSSCSNYVFTTTKCKQKVKIMSRGNPLYAVSLYTNSPMYRIKYIN